MTKERIDIRGIIVTLAAEFPAAFSVFERRRKPLKIGIHFDILARLDGAIEPEDLAAAMQCYVRNPFYLKACVEGAVRVDLDGREAGAVSPEHAAGSAAALAAYYARRKPKTKPEAQPEIAAPASAPPTGPKRLGLGDLKAAALARKRAS